MNKFEEILNKKYTIDKTGIVTNSNNKKLKPMIYSGGYYEFKYRKDKKFIHVLYHRFQAYMKFGDKIFEKGIMVRHLDGNKLNNHWDNLALGTNSDNQMDICSEVRQKRASHPKYDHQEILKDREDGMTYKEIMEKHGIKSKSTVSHIINKSLAQE